MTLDDIRQAAQRIRPIAHRTPVMTSRTFNALTGVEAFFKCENLQRGGAFKIRGAANFIFSIPEADRARGVVAYSSGNHAQAVAIAAASVGAPATIVMPADAPRSKLEATRGYGARVVIYDRLLEDREEIGRRIAAETGALSVYCTGALANTGRLENLPNTTLLIDADSVDQTGTIRVGSGGGVSFIGCDLQNKSGATLSLLGGTISAPNLIQKAGAAFTGFGGISANLTNEGVIDLYGPSQIVGNVANAAAGLLKIRNADLLIAGNTVNNGAILAVNGKVYFEGTLQNNGTIHMDPSTAVCVGDMTVGPDGRLVGDAGSTFQFMANFANASTRASDFDLASSTVEFISPDPGAGPHDLEAAGRDLGAVAGAWTGNFALGRLAVGTANWAATVRLVDAADNPSDGQPDALYVHDLTVAADSRLEACGIHLYTDGEMDIQGRLDLDTGGLVARYAAASPLLAIRDLLASGRSGGTWDGVGIVSSAAAAQADRLTAVGVLDNTDEKVGGKTTFEGEPVDATAVLVKYTWGGDANLNGVVDANDYDVIDKSFLFTPDPDHMGWWTGDFNYDGVIDANDYDLIDKAFLFQTGPLDTGAPSPMPEPATLALLALGAAAALRRRRA